MDTLATELILRIVAELWEIECDSPCCWGNCDIGLKSVAWFSRVSRRLHAIVTPELYHAVDLGTYRLRYLLHAIVQSPDKAPLVRKVTFSWKEYKNSETLSESITSPERGQALRRAAVRSNQRWKLATLDKLEDGSADAESTLLLQLLPNLTALELHFPPEFMNVDERESYREGLARVFPHPMLLSMLTSRSLSASPGGSRPLAHVERLSISNPFETPWVLNNHSFPPVQLWDLSTVKNVFFWPKLRSLSLERCGSDFTPGRGCKNLFTIFGTLRHTSNLEEISITNSFVHADQLTSILRLTHKLKKFKYSVAKAQELWAVDMMAPEITLPKQLLKGIEFHKHTLESLEICSIQKDRSWQCHKRYGSGFDHYGGDYDEDDEQGAIDLAKARWCAIKKRFVQPIDLHDFTALKHVSTHATDLLGPMIRASPNFHYDLRSVLPPSLESLTLDYSLYFYDLEPQGYEYEADCEVEDAWFQDYYRHVAELAAAKPDAFPRLNLLETKLDQGWPEPYEEIMEAARVAGITLLVRRREDVGQDW